MFSEDQYDPNQGMQQRNQAGEELVEKEYSIPDEMAGLIIGRGGERINKLQAESGCRVQIFPRTQGDPNRRCKLTGSRESVRAVKSLIEQIISQSGHHVTEMMIPGLKVGRLIGKGGENLKQLQEKCGVKMVVIQEGPEPTIYAKPLRISGDKENVEFAEKVVTDFLAQRDTKFAEKVVTDLLVQRDTEFAEKAVTDFLAQRDTKVSKRVFASRPVYKDDLLSVPVQEQGDSNFFLRAIIGVIILWFVVSFMQGRI